MNFKDFYIESTRPHPYFGKMKKWGTNKTPTTKSARMELVFDSNDGKFQVHYAETDAGQFFIWTNNTGQDGFLEYRQFKRMKLAMNYLKNRFGITLKGWENITALRKEKLPKHVWK